MIDNNAEIVMVWFDKFLGLLIFSGFFGYFCFVFGTFEQLVTPSDLVRDLIDTTDTTENEI